MITLRHPTSMEWVNAILKDFDRFLVDHAAAEKKASGMAMSMLSHYPDKPDLVIAMTDLCIEEMIHFKEVMKLMAKRNLTLAPDTKDHYVNALRQLHRKGTDFYMLDRLLIAGIIEARGCERFGLVAKHIEDEALKVFYKEITDSEEKHSDLFTDLAGLYFKQDEINERLSVLLDAEAEIVKSLPIVAALH